MNTKKITKRMGRPIVGESKKLPFSSCLKQADIDYIKTLGNGTLNKGLEKLIEYYKINT